MSTRTNSRSVIIHGAKPQASVMLTRVVCMVLIVFSMETRLMLPRTETKLPTSVGVIPCNVRGTMTSWAARLEARFNEWVEVCREGRMLPKLVCSILEMQVSHFTIIVTALSIEGLTWLNKFRLGTLKLTRHSMMTTGMLCTIAAQTNVRTCSGNRTGEWSACINVTSASRTVMLIIVMSRMWTPSYRLLSIRGNDPMKHLLEKKALPICG